MTDERFIGIEVGKVYPGWTPGTYPEGVVFDFSGSGAITLLSYNRPKMNEIFNVRRGKIRVGIFNVRGIEFVLMKFGNLPWVDAPYHIVLSKPFEITEIKDYDLSHGYAWSIVMFDNLTGIVKAIRFVTMPHKTSLKLYDAIQIQKDFAASGREFNAISYIRTIDEIYARYSTNDLVKMAEMVGGIEEIAVVKK